MGQVGAEAGRFRRRNRSSTASRRPLPVTASSTPSTSITSTDVKGFSTQGKFALELETVYVDLDVDPTVAGDISEDPIRLPNDAAESGHRDIFAWLRADPAHPHNFAIVGPPVAARPPYLKHLALLVSAKRAPVRATPVLLFLRDHAAAIGANADIKLTDLIDASLKDLPPPKPWFQARLKKGKCLIMLDGLDEVADQALRRKVVGWVERQVESLGGNRFLVSSRPNGYRDNPLSGFTALQILPFRRDQVERFVRNWYFANEVVAHQKNDLGVRMEADKGATALLERLRNAPTLQELAVNPLLLTLIATVHRYRSELPGRRVELFTEICDVFLGKRQQAKGLVLDLTPPQKVRILRVLAYEMMCRQAREIKVTEAAEVIAPVLKLVMPEGEPEAFLRVVEDSSALLVQKEGGVYGFAHLTFQEYLASLHIKEEKLVERLTACVDQTWWHETARLYAAQADATPLVDKCLAADRPSTEALLLAADCEREALQLRPDLRDRLHQITEGAVEDVYPSRRQQAAEYLLERRLRDMVRLSEDRYIDRSPVTHAEYQLFMDEMRAQGEFRHPDHWNTYEFPQGAGLQPIVGLRKSDAEKFCEWLTARKQGRWEYTLPTSAEVRTLCDASAAQRHDPMRFFSEPWDEAIPSLSWSQILDQVKKDQGSTTTRAFHRLTWLIYYLAVLLDRAGARDRANALARDRDLDRARARVLDYAGADASAVPRLINLTGALPRDLAVARDLASTHDFVRDRDRALTRSSHLDLARAVTAAFDAATAVAHQRDHVFSRQDLDRAFAAYVLNWLCVIEKRAKGEMPVVDSLWIAKSRQQAHDEASAAPPKGQGTGVARIARSAG